jgi:hypothetical protein
MILNLAVVRGKAVKEVQKEKKLIVWWGDSNALNVYILPMHWPHEPLSRRLANVPTRQSASRFRVSRPTDHYTDQAEPTFPCLRTYGVTDRAIYSNLINLTIKHYVR